MFSKQTRMVVLFLALFGASSLHLAHAIPEDQTPAEPAPLKGEALHIKWVSVAVEYDAFNKRCRGVSVSKHLKETSRLFLTKYGMTANNFIKAHIERDPRKFQNRIQQQLNQTLFELGGCSKAKETGLVDRFQNDFKTLKEQVERSAWFPNT